MHLTRYSNFYYVHIVFLFFYFCQFSKFLFLTHFEKFVYYFFLIFFKTFKYHKFFFEKIAHITFLSKINKHIFVLTQTRLLINL